MLRRLRETGGTRPGQVFDVSHLGLVEMARKNVSAGLLGTSRKCEHCAGRGIIIDESFRPRNAPVDQASAEVEA